MKADVRLLPSAKVLQELAKLFIIEAHDRHVYCVSGPMPVCILSRKDPRRKSTKQASILRQNHEKCYSRISSYPHADE